MIIFYGAIVDKLWTKIAAAVDNGVEKSVTLDAS